MGREPTVAGMQKLGESPKTMGLQSILGVSAIALSLILVAVTALAQPGGPDRQAHPPEPSDSQEIAPNPLVALFSQLDLTATQKNQVQDIQIFYQAQVRQILTPAQMAQAQTLDINAAGRVLEQLQLSSQQKSKLQTAQLLAEQRLLSILNPTQQQKLLKLSQAATPNSATVTASAAVQGSGPVAQSQPEPQSPPEGQEAVLARLNLTAQQKTQLQEITTFYKAQLKQILTPAQVNQLKTLGIPADDRGLARVGLSAQQKSKVQEARQLADQRFFLLLTPAQQQTLRSLASGGQP